MAASSGHACLNPESRHCQTAMGRPLGVMGRPLPFHDMNPLVGGVR